MLTGGCFCGAVRYAVTAAPSHPTLCHCADCRRIAGAPAVAWFTVSVAGFHLTDGQPRRCRSSPRVERQFCGDCGTGLTYRHDDLAEIDITLCSLDAPERLAPADEIWCSRRLPWMEPGRRRPEYPRARPAE